MKSRLLSQVKNWPWGHLLFSITPGLMMTMPWLSEEEQLCGWPCAQRSMLWLSEEEELCGWPCAQRSMLWLSEEEELCGWPCAQKEISRICWFFL